VDRCPNRHRWAALPARWHPGSKAGGGSCFGDSGGGVFLDGYVLGDASYVNSLTRNALGSYQRDDTTHSRAFLDSFIAP